MKKKNIKKEIIRIHEILNNMDIRIQSLEKNLEPTEIENERNEVLPPEDLSWKDTPNEDIPVEKPKKSPNFEMGYVFGSKTYLFSNTYYYHCRNCGKIKDYVEGPNRPQCLECMIPMDDHESNYLAEMYENIELVSDKKPPTHSVDDNKKVAVHAPEPWQKEKVVKILKKPICKEDYWFWKNHVIIVNEKGCLFAGSIYNIREGNSIIELKEVEEFEDFCHRHGEPDNPDYVKDVDGKVMKPDYWKFLEIAGKIAPFWNDGTFMPSYDPATEKEYLEQLRQKYPYPNDDLNAIEDDEEFELKLNEEWKLKNARVCGPNQYWFGTKDMQKAIYNRALEEYNETLPIRPNIAKKQAWRYACEQAIEDLKQGKIKPPQ